MSSPLLKNLEAPTTQELHAETPDLICVISPTYWKLLVFFFWPQVVIVVLKSRLTLCDPIDCCCQASLSFTISLSLLKLMSIESVMPSNHLILCRPLLPFIFPSIKVSSYESALCNRWPKYWSFSFTISLSSEYSGLISFRIDWFDLLAVQGTLRSFLQHHGLKALVISFLYGPTLTSMHDYWKNHSFDSTALCWQSDVSAF